MRKKILALSTLLAVIVMVLGALGVAYGFPAYYTALSAACPGAACTACHTSASGPPPFTAYGSSFSSIPTHSTDPAGAIATIGCPGGAPPPPPTCTSFTYSDWSACDPSTSMQTRTVISSSPPGCTGGTPVITQSCNPTVLPPPTPPPPSTSTIPLPTGEQVFTYTPVELPVLNSDPSQAMPIGVGPVAKGGDTLDIAVNIGPFATPVDISFAAYGVSFDSGDVYLLDETTSFVLASAVMANVGKSESDNDGQGAGQSGEKVENRIIWKRNVTSVNEHIYGPYPLSILPSGPYILALGARPSGQSDGSDASYHWVTYFFVP